MCCPVQDARVSGSDRSVPLVGRNLVKCGLQCHKFISSGCMYHFLGPGLLVLIHPDLQVLGRLIICLQSLFRDTLVILLLVWCRLLQMVLEQLSCDNFHYYMW